MRVVKKRKPDAVPSTPLEAMLHEFKRSQTVENYSEQTISNRTFHLATFVQWCQERGLTDPAEVTRPVLERYQRHLFHYRKKNGEPMSFRSQHSRLSPLRVWFRWMTRKNYLLHNPASELVLPRLNRPLPKNILTASEVEQVMTTCDIHDPTGLRDRAILEVLYSTGIRRMEIIALKLYDLALDRGVVYVREGKGGRDRYVPIGARAIQWLRKYIDEARPQLVSEPDDMTVFITSFGEPFSRNHMSQSVKDRIDAANLGRTGACHLFRHTMATLMLENGADIRHIQEILGHVKLETTQIYTHVSIRALQQVHASTHPAEAHGKSKSKNAASIAELEELLATLRAEEDNDSSE